MINKCQDFKHNHTEQRFNHIRKAIYMLWSGEDDPDLPAKEDDQHMPLS